MNLKLPFQRGKAEPAELAQIKAPPLFNNLTEIRWVEEEYIVDYSGRRYPVWRVIGADSTDDQVINGWHLFLNSIEFPVQIIIRQHAPDLSKVRRDLMDARPENMRTGPINLVGNSMLDYLKTMEDRGKVVERRWYVVAPEERELELHSILGQTGRTFYRMFGDDLRELVEACSSGMGVGHRQDVYQGVVHRRHIEFNHRFAKIFDVHKWPRRTSLLFLEQLLRTGEEMDLSFWIWPLRSKESNSRLQAQRSRFEGARIMQEQKNKLVSPQIRLVIQDVTRLAEEVERGVSKLYRVTLTIAVYAKDRQSLEQSAENIAGHFRASLAGIRLLRLRQGSGLKALMPALRRGAGEPYLTDTGTLLRFFPFGPPDLDKRSGTLLAMDLRSRTPVIYDAFDDKETNGHMVVMARSGAGKSFLTKLRVLREALRDVRIYLIDPEGEYGVITRALGGRVLIPGTPGYGLNPFVIGYSDPQGLAERVASLCRLFELMLEGEVDAHRKSIIDEALTGFYEKELRDAAALGNEVSARVLGRGGMAAFYDFLTASDSDSDADKDRRYLARLLRRFATGSVRYLMSGDGEDLSQNEAPVTSFNLKSLPRNLKPVAISVCAEVVWGLAVSDQRPRLLIVDECWMVLATPSGAEVLIEIIKRARKFGLNLMTVTQDVQDLLGVHSEGGAVLGHAGRSLLQNSATKLALGQDPAALPALVEALGLNNDCASFLSGTLRGQGILVSEWGNFPIEVVSTPEERALINDDSWRQDGAVLEIEDGIDDPEALASSLRSRVHRERMPDVELEAAAAD